MAKRKRLIIVLLLLSLIVSLIIGGYAVYGSYQMKKIPGMSFQEVLEYTTKDKPEAVISVGIIQDGQVSTFIYGANGQEIPDQSLRYEIGSITKTFTAALIRRAAREGRIDLDDTIDQYLHLDQDKAYPTISQLLTHTSGYRSEYFELQMVSNFFRASNSYYGISRPQILKKISASNRSSGEHSFRYSNFGYAVLGLVLEAVYDTDYTALLHDFIQTELGLAETKISTNTEESDNYWDWKLDDAYLPAGAILSNLNDMLVYAQRQLGNDPLFSQTHHPLKTINASPESYQAMGIRMDEIAMAWIIDSENNILWHNGATGSFNSYQGFHPGTRTAVVVLSNLSPNDRIPATIMGTKLMMELLHEAAVH